MHYYKKNIGDYAKKTGRLTMLQHGAYTLLIDSCYDRERFPTLDEAIEWTWSLSDEEIAAVKFVLQRFFTLEGDLYVQTRIKEEIAEYHGKSIKNKEIALEREAKRRGESTTRTRNVHETPPNQEPRTTNHKPIINTKTPDGVSDSVFQDFVKLRKGLKAPVTATAIKGLKREGDKAGISLEQVMEICCKNGWRGFDADWVVGKGDIKKPVSYETRQTENGLEWKHPIGGWQLTSVVPLPKAAA